VDKYFLRETSSVIFPRENKKARVNRAKVSLTFFVHEAPGAFCELFESFVVFLLQDLDYFGVFGICRFARMDDDAECAVVFLEDRRRVAKFGVHAFFTPSR
jgi:hypothetical protein